MMPTIYARSAILGFMHTRCAVSSQHKLPTESELIATEFAEILGAQVVAHVLRQLLNEGALRAYGPYLSDREIEAL